MTKRKVRPKMTPADARRKMRKARHARAAKGGVRPGWYYLEDTGIYVLAVAGNGTTQVRLTWRQIEQALALHRAAQTDT